MTNRIPVVDYLVLDPQPRLQAHECSACRALYFDHRDACGRCGHTTFGTRALATTGQVRAFTIVRRASPKVKTPYISVIVDLDGGGVVKANLLDPEPDATTITPRLPVALSTFVVGTDDEGTEAVAFGFSRAGAN
jgi:uncharacterized OB-fold protein